MTACGKKSNNTEEPNNNNPAIEEPVKTYYKVTFNTNGGSEVTAVQVESGAKATEPTAPTKEYYDFMGWYTDEALTKAFDFTTTTITENITLYAKWEKVSVTVAYAEDYAGGYDSVKVTSYASAAAAKADLRDATGFIETQDTTNMTADELAMYEATVAYQVKHFDQMISSEAMHVNECHKYVIKLAEDDVENIGDYATDYLAKYAGWDDMSSSGSSIKQYFKSNSERDVYVMLSVDATAGTLTANVFSFDSGYMEAMESSIVIDYAKNYTEPFDSWDIAWAPIAQVIKQTIVDVIDQEESGFTYDLLNSIIKDEDINLDECSSYVISIPTEVIENYDENKTYTVGDNTYNGLAAYYEEYFQKYCAKYSDWTDIKNVEGFEDAFAGAEGIYYTSTAERDVLMSAEYNTADTTMTIYVLSFKSGSMAQFFKDLGTAMSQQQNG